MLLWGLLYELLKCGNWFNLARPQNKRNNVILGFGEVSEWLKEHAWKVCIGLSLSRVRIPPSPPYFKKWKIYGLKFHFV